MKALDMKTGTLLTYTAATFYGLNPILIPPEQDLDTLAGILTETRAEVLIAGAGALSLNELLQKYRSLKQIIWVVERTSRHMDWNEVPEGVGGKADIAVWHDIIDEKASMPSELPTEIPGGAVPDVLCVVEDGISALDSYEIVTFTQKVISPNARPSDTLLIPTTEHRSRNCCPNLRPPT